MLTFKTSGLVEPERRSAVSWGEEGASDLKPAHLLRFLGEGAARNTYCCLAVIIFLLNRPMTSPFLESGLTLLKKPSIRLFQMQLEWGLVYARLQSPPGGFSSMILTANYHEPGRTRGIMLKLGDGSLACYCHTCTWGKRAHPAQGASPALCLRTEGHPTEGGDCVRS